MEVLLNLLSFFFLVNQFVFSSGLIVGKHVGSTIQGEASKVRNLMGSVMGPTKGLAIGTVMKHLKTCPIR